MCYHEWGDEWFEKYGRELGAAERYIGRFVKRWSGCRVISKEKYGTIRYEHIFPPYGAFFIRDHWINKCLRLLGKTYYSYEVLGETREGFFYTTWNRTALYYYWSQLGKKVLKIAIHKACKKFPNVKDEILDDWDEDYI